jgi:hypothetical protein
MNHWLIAADRITHLKITTVALVCAVALVVIGLFARIDNNETANARLHADGPVLKLGKPTTITTRETSTLR